MTFGNGGLLDMSKFKHDPEEKKSYVLILHIVNHHAISQPNPHEHIAHARKMKTRYNR